MSVRKIERLNVWEIAHRWEHIDPDSVMQGGIPMEVRDRVRELAHAATVALNCYDPHGELIPMEKLLFGFQKTNFAKRLDLAIHDPIGHKDLLLGVYLDQTEVMKWCFESAKDLPEFWFEPGEVQMQREFLNRGRPPAVAAPKLRPDQEDKANCQAIADRLWKEYPAMTIADMTRRREILVDGSGKAYKGKNTLRNWLKEVAPRDVRARVGRPKKPKVPEKPP